MSKGPGLKNSRPFEIRALIKRYIPFLPNNSGKTAIVAFFLVCDKVDFHSPIKILEIGEKP
jgi:hypothetical protein